MRVEQTEVGMASLALCGALRFAALSLEEPGHSELVDRLVVCLDRFLRCHSVILGNKSAFARATCKAGLIEKRSMSSAHEEGLYACESFLEQLTIPADGEQLVAFNRMSESAEKWMGEQLTLPKEEVAGYQSEPESVRKMNEGPMLGGFGFRENNLKTNIANVRKWLVNRNIGAPNVSPNAGGWHRTVKTLHINASSLRALALQAELELAWVDLPQDQPLKTTPLPDGPFEPRGFRWKGAVTELPPIPWRLVNALWSAPNKSMPQDDIADEVWGKSEASGLKNACSEASKLLNDSKPPIPITVRRKGGFVYLDIDTPESPEK